MTLFMKLFLDVNYDQTSPTTLNSHQVAILNLSVCQTPFFFLFVLCYNKGVPLPPHDLNCILKHIELTGNYSEN